MTIIFKASDDIHKVVELGYDQFLLCMSNPSPTNMNKLAAIIYPLIDDGWYENILYVYFLAYRRYLNELQR